MVRPETGYMKFGTDWRGVFIRGDSSMAFGAALRRLLAGDAAAIGDVAELAELLEGADENKPVQVLHVKVLEAVTGGPKGTGSRRSF